MSNLNFCILYSLLFKTILVLRNMFSLYRHVRQSVCRSVSMYVIFIHLFFSFTSSSLEPDVMCGYRLYFTNATWHTAYKICEEEKKMLVLPDSDINTFGAILSHLITKRLGATSLKNGYVLLIGHLNHLGDQLQSFFVSRRSCVNI